MWLLSLWGSGKKRENLEEVCYKWYDKVDKAGISCLNFNQAVFYQIAEAGSNHLDHQNRLISRWVT